MTARDAGGTPKVCAHTEWNGHAAAYCPRQDVSLVGTVWLCPAHEGVQP